MTSWTSCTRSSMSADMRCAARSALCSVLRVSSAASAMDWEGADLASAGAQPHGCSLRVGERGVDVGRHCSVDGGCCERKVVVVVKKNNVMGVGTKDASLPRARGTACAAAPCRDQNPPSLVSHGITPAARDSSAVTQARSLPGPYVQRKWGLGMSLTWHRETPTYNWSAAQQR